MNKYYISKVEDLLDVPQDRLAECIQDLHDWVLCVHALRREFNNPHLPQFESRGYVWVDDGKRGCSGIKVTIMHEEGVQP
jgi:hypothetical protein